MPSPIVAEVLRERAVANRTRIGFGAPQQPPSPPPTGEIRQPTWADFFANLPANLLGVDYGNPNKTDMAMALSQAMFPEPSKLAVLLGPAAYAVRRASPGLGKYLANRPESFYAHFTDMPTPGGAALETVGFAKPMDAQRAKDLSVINDFLAGLGQIPTVQNVKSGAILRGTARNPYQALPQPLKTGDVELGFSREFDPNVFRGRETRAGMMPGSKSKGTLSQQRETAVHEGMHGSWLGKTGGQSGNPPLTEDQVAQVWKWIWESGVDPITVLQKMESGMGKDTQHLFLEAAAKRAANRR